MAPTVPRNLVAVGLTFVVLAIGTLVFTDLDRSSMTGMLIGGIILAIVGAVLLARQRRDIAADT